MQSRFGVFITLAVLATLLQGAAGSPASAATFSARASQASPIVGESIRISGSVPPARRPVVLQVYSSGRWVAVRSTRTATGGRYGFTVKATALARSFRMFARKAKLNGKNYPARYSNRVRIIGIRATLGLGVVAAPVGQLSSGTSGVTPGRASFRPARPGAGVAIQRLVSGSWTTVKSGGRQNAAGNYYFNVVAGSAGSPATFRAYSSPGSGVPTQFSTAVTPDYLPQVFNDDFNGTTLSDQWATRVQQPSGRRQCAQPDAGQVTVTNGAAVLGVKKVATPAGRRCPYGFWHNGMIGTAVASNPFTTTNGIFAARVKFQAGGGMHGAFWLQGPKATGAELDVAEYFGDGRTDGGLANYVHYTDAYGGTSSSGGIHQVKSILGAGRTPSNSWHVYSVEWNRSGYIFRVDGTPVFSTNKPFVATAPEGMILSLLTSDWELPRLKRPSSTMQVGWVRAWHRD
jgi:hypothetical protein